VEGIADQLWAISSSDLDLLVVKDGASRRALAQEIYAHMRGVEIGLDIVVATRDDLERFKNSRTVVIGQALREGKVIYDEAA
jgi:predicted nucleotidyltransferase